jgi:hypothetical protein
MTLDSETIARIVGPLLSLIVGGIIKHYSEARAKVVSFIGHVSSFTLQDEKRTIVHTHSVVVRNAGRKAAHNVRLAHRVLPVNVTIYPPVQYSIEHNPEGASEIVLPVLVPKEQVTVSYLYFPPLTWDQVNASTKSDEGFAKILNVIPMPQPHKAVLTAVWALVFIGTSFVFYWLIRLSAYVL